MIFQSLMSTHKQAIATFVVVFGFGYFYFSSGASESLHSIPTPTQGDTRKTSENSDIGTENPLHISNSSGSAQQGELIVSHLSTPGLQNNPGTQVNTDFDVSDAEILNEPNTPINVLEELFTDTQQTVELDIPLHETDLKNPISQLPVEYRKHVTDAVSMDISFELDGIPAVTTINLQSGDFPDIGLTANKAAELYNQRLTERSSIPITTEPANYRITSLVFPQKTLSN